MKKVIYTLCLAGFLCGCGTTKKQVEQQPIVNIQFNADSAYQFCAAQCDFGPRTMNSEAHERCAQWISQKFQQYGYTVELQKADLKGYDGTILKSTNIIASSQPSTPNSQLPKVLICAHWDSRPWADNDPDSANWRKPVMAANDGASGVAVMLELARLIQQHDSLNVAVDFICFDAEDWGIPQWDETGDGTDSWALGAQYWAKKYQEKSLHSQPSTLNYQYAILLDMVGGQGAKFYQEGYSKQKAGRIVEKIWRAAHAAGYGSTFPMQESGFVTDDHVPVNDIANIPCVDIINHYPDCPQSSFGPTWHTVNDDMQHIDKNTLQAVGQTLLQVLYNE
jgi:Zn-dependent M28 family amino/carboxypeptidase